MNAEDYENEICRPKIPFQPHDMYAYFVGANYKYVPELCALLNSLEYVGNHFDVVVIGINLPKEFIDQCSKIKNYAIHHYDVPEEEIVAARGESEILCRKRYWYAGEWGRVYDACCVLDADMIFNRDPWKFFTIANKCNFVLGATKEQCKVYNDPHHLVDDETIVDPEFWNDMDLCNCPLFFDPGSFGEALKLSWYWFEHQGFKAPDMDAMNMALYNAGSYYRTIKLPGLQWLGTNEQLLKTYTKATIRRDGKLWTEGGLEIFSYHGQFYHDKWRMTQLANRKGCIAGRLDGSEKSYGDAVSGLGVLTDVFNKMLDYRIQIEKRDYRHEEI
jgi:hypothetical protein